MNAAIGISIAWVALFSSRSPTLASTAVLEFAGARLRTDPTFDQAAYEYRFGQAMLRKLSGPALPASAVGKIDYVLLSH